jgi:hypothetical protein
MDAPRADFHRSDAVEAIAGAAKAEELAVRHGRHAVGVQRAVYNLRPGQPTTLQTVLEARRHGRAKLRQ